ncbi:regulatory ArsR family protein [Actinocrispum wychmicini]|uniref:Regulatory ArsR family protein n=2 Tax=Actinocrispum wychmicini TaxID=1213861 RepID=A0A4R2K517_9PSEU|nr:winged helix-turn-helix domain-containing protein [Actinocrispum wychmicini]TCO64878.1 regulatory ArsR family protein [Actinocrispum wychmicini]
MYFTSADIARTRVAPRPDPLWELILAIQMLRRQPGDLLFHTWRDQAKDAMRSADFGARLRPLLALVPRIGYFPDFLTPSDSLYGLAEGLDAIRFTPRPMLRNDIQCLARSRHLAYLPPTAGPLAAGDPTTLVELTDTLQACYDLTVRPHHRGAHSALARDRQLRAEALADNGVDGLFASLHPWVSWSHGELRIPGHCDQEMFLDGRGLLLIPAYFCVGAPITLFDAALPPVLIYPAQHHLDTLPGRENTPRAALTALVGGTRAAILNAIGAHLDPVTTTDLSRHLTISAASASEHTTVLRNAGLITSHREGNRMLHRPTSLGRELLTTAW